MLGIDGGGPKGGESRSNGEICDRRATGVNSAPGIEEGAFGGEVYGRGRAGAVILGGGNVWVLFDRGNLGDELARTEDKFYWLIVGRVELLVQRRSGLC